MRIIRSVARTIGLGNRLRKTSGGKFYYSYT